MLRISLAPRSRASTLVAAAWRGALLGGAIAGAFIGFGLLITVGMVLIHGRLPQATWTWADTRAAVAYVGSFMVVGALLGAGGPLLRRRGGVWVGGVVAGILGMTLMVLGIEGWAGMDGWRWAMAGVFGAIFGIAGAIGWRRAR